MPAANGRSPIARHVGAETTWPGAPGRPDPYVTGAAPERRGNDRSVGAMLRASQLRIVPIRAESKTILVPMGQPPLVGVRGGSPGASPASPGRMVVRVSPRRGA